MHFDGEQSRGFYLFVIVFFNLSLTEASIRSQFLDVHNALRNVN